MDFLQNLRLTTIPWPLRVIFAVTAALVLALNCYILYVGFSTNNYDVWIAAGGYLLGVILPIILIFLVIQFSHSGVRALRDRTGNVLTKLIPFQLRLTADCTDGTTNDAKARNKRSLTRVDVRHIRGECWADYVLLIPQQSAEGRNFSTLRLRIEVNVRRANIDIFVPAAALKADPHATIVSLFPHTLMGAERADYTINQSSVRRNAEGEQFDCLVLVRELGKEFLWDAAEQLWFAQDLMFMLRSFVQERPDLFQLKEN